MFKCTLRNGQQVAVKRIVLTNEKRVRDFVAEGCFGAELFAAGVGLQMYSMSLYMGSNGRDVHEKVIMQLADMDLEQGQVLMVDRVRQG